ncbi:MAG: hypothetical protein A2Y62_21920 [Candidatus Fischerbacteria bacterium RBG_13_37_8]|uniref:AMP-activated protein kinase glycogen-binding domain-containing protein n=1 Tax=Candidatus Fischerbacteria bacterium RBG_13_37_8 TaxID=1817863 RepID=A0A1F5VTT3_9BACT|nr:MAG: hypothetical protein A2Y62_21920 [Candidatus Fischerbacteria bacterium RBG_13_37_8]
MKKQTKKIVFKIYAPEAQEIYLTGDFNEWDYRSLSMVKREDGVWEVEQELLPGEYQYKYIIDGRWEIDNRQEMRANEFGTMNNIIKIN